MAFLCPGFLIGMATNARRQIASYQRPEVQGTVVGLSVKPWLESERVAKDFGRVAFMRGLQVISPARAR